MKRMCKKGSSKPSGKRLKGGGRGEGLDMREREERGVEKHCPFQIGNSIV